jgi:hypothetical protein
MHYASVGAATPGENRTFKMDEPVKGTRQVNPFSSVKINKSGNTLINKR